MVLVICISLEYASNVLETLGSAVPLLLSNIFGCINKPVILSSGMSHWEEVVKSLEFISSHAAKDVAMLPCTANYPVDITFANIGIMSRYKNELNVITGYSDHTLSHIAPIMAMALGASVYEAHITLGKSLPGPDHRASFEPHQIKDVISQIRLAETALGDSVKVPLEVEKENRIKLRKSIVSKITIEKGEVFTEKNLTCKRPGDGISPDQYFNLLGKVALRKIETDTLLVEQDFEN